MLPENKKGLLVTGWKNHIYIEQTKNGYVFSDDYDEEEFLSYEKMKEYELKERDRSKSSTTRSGQKQHRINGFCKNNGNREINKRNRRTKKPDTVSK